MSQAGTRQARLAEGVGRLGLALGGAEQARLLAYLDLLAKWNRIYNLTAVRDPDEMLTLHLLDSLSVTPWVQGERVLDVGSGAGLPGIPLAIALPRFRFTLLDSNAKKTRFMIQAVAELGLDNVRVEQARVSEFKPEKSFNTVISRAFASIADFLDGAGHLSAADGQLLAMKGVYPRQELEGLPPGFRLESVQKLMVPGLKAERHLAILSPQSG
jgi:16S rRNA (guanine527-N7)-methyltransferase